MYRIAYNYTYTKEDALDIIQTSFEKVLVSIQKNKEIDDIKSWFYRTLIHTAIDFWRKNKFTNDMLENSPYLTEDFKFNENNYEDIHELINNMPTPEREIILLKYFEGFTLKEISHMLSMNENTVKTKLYRALELLREKI